jgi:hypothetical protein
MLKIFTIFALVLLANPAAAAGPRDMLVPPPEFDYPYRGELTIVDALDQEQVRAKCPGAKFTIGVALACAIRWPLSCTIVLAPEADLKAAGLPLDLVMRHELAHCNGWPSDHRGARQFHDWAEEVKPQKIFQERFPN